MQHALNYKEWKAIPKSKPNSCLDLFLFQPQSIENLSLIYRSAEAFSVNQILIYQPKMDLDDTRIKRVSRSASQKMASHIIYEQESMKQTFDNYPLLLALEWTNTSSDLYTIKKVRRNTLLILGNERFGIPKHILAEAHKSVHIPISGSQSSINLACASSIALSYLHRLRT